MPAALRDEATAARRAQVVDAARSCFLHFGFSKTSLEDIAKRAGLSRTLLYRLFKDKEDIARAVFADLLLAQLPLAQAAARSTEPAAARLLTVCRLLRLEPWAKLADAPLGAEFLALAARVDPHGAAQHRAALRECLTAILGDDASAEVFALALDGQIADQPSAPQLQQRVALLIERFVASAAQRSTTKSPRR